MKRLIVLTLLSVVGLVSCSKDDSAIGVAINSLSPTPDQEATTLRQRFQGKYQIFSSVSSEPLDINLDGTPSTNMLHEVSELTLNDGTKYNIELRITDPSLVNPAYAPANYVPVPEYFFVQWWPEQFIRTGPGKVWDNNTLIDYDPGFKVEYDFQSKLRKFSFSADRKLITVIPDEDETSFRWVRPESVTINADDTIQIVNKRRLYTSAGVKDVVITTVYKRYTTIT